uniref:Uncharacterized protein n=1 Tax=Guillardia theta TaxID=55529 RepID=A0A7S4M0S6_GUITH|mmetsp:Transcript_13472/g.46878  ORF Transcript_13472/g.46878 Transcript_13472/m.46878 type:complete len:728 (+) Transcript_13472:42-2225(+)
MKTFLCLLLAWALLCFQVECFLFSGSTLHPTRRVISNPPKTLRKKGGGLRLLSAVSRPESGKDEIRREGVARRSMLVVSAAALSGFFLPVGERRAAAKQPPGLVWRPVSGPEGSAIRTNMNAAESTYSLRFIEYLSKFLLNYDASSMALWKRRGEELSVLPMDAYQDKRLEQFASFSASVEYGLKSYNGTEGAARLVKLLVRRFGSADRDALQQIGFLFTLMDKFQPTQEIQSVLSMWENASLTKVSLVSRGSGYTGAAPEVDVLVDYDPAVKAQAKCLLRPNGKILRVEVEDGGGNFSKPPRVVFEGLDELAKMGMMEENFKKPKAEAVVEDGRVVGVKMKAAGSGIGRVSKEYLRVNFLPDESEDQMAAAGRGYAVLDKEVDRIEILNPGAGYTTSCPWKVKVQSPIDSGGDTNGTTATAIATFGRLGNTSAKKVAMNSQDTKTIDEVLTRLLPSSVRVEYDPSSNRFSFVEKSLLGNNISTPFGPLGKVSRRAPIEKESNLDGSVYWRLAASGAICASFAHAALVPLDTVKIRMQTAPQGTYDGLLDAAVKVLTKEGGLTALLRGLQPEVAGFGIYGALSFGGTEFFRRFFADLAGPKLSLLYPVPVVVLSSVTAAVFAAAAACPFMAVKTRLIADEKFAGSSLIKGWNRMQEEEGWSSLFSGLVPMLVKDVLFVMSKFAVFDVTKTSIFLAFPELRDDLGSILFVSLVSGISSSRAGRDCDDV